VRIASFNVENLFDRARLLAADDWATHRSLLDTYAKLTRTLQHAAYSATDKANIVKWLVALGLEKADSGTYVILRQNRGRLIRRPQAGGIRHPPRGDSRLQPAGVRMGPGGQSAVRQQQQRSQVHQNRK